MKQLVYLFQIIFFKLGQKTNQNKNKVKTKKQNKTKTYQKSFVSVPLAHISKLPAFAFHKIFFFFFGLISKN